MSRASPKPRRPSTGLRIPVNEVPSPQDPYIRGKPVHVVQSRRKSPVRPVLTKKYASEVFAGEMLSAREIIGSSRTSRPDSYRSARSTTGSGLGLASERYMRHEQVLEAFLLNTATMPVEKAIEETFQISLNAKNVVVWTDIPNLHTLCSERLGKICSHSAGLVGYTFFSREILKAEKASEHASYNPDVDGPITGENSPVLLFPLWDNNNNVCSVVECIREPNHPFDDPEDEVFIQFFTKKFMVYSQWFTQTRSVKDASLELMQSMELEQFLLVAQRTVCGMFHCKRCEIWKRDLETMETWRFVKTGEKIPTEKAGIVGESLANNFAMNCMTNKMQSSYCEEADGTVSEPVLVVPVQDPRQKQKFAIALRGRKDLPCFTRKDELALRELAPFILLAFDNDTKFSEHGMQTSKQRQMQECNTALQQIVDHLCDGAPMEDILVESLKSVEALVKAERCYYFVMDKHKQNYVTKYASGIKKPSLSMAVGHGIVGATFAGKKIINLPDAYEDTVFNSAFDLETDFKTKSIVSVPVLDNRREVIAVVQLLNRRDGKPFSNIDVGYIKLFTVFCGLVMENQDMYDDATDKSKKLRSYMSVSLSLSSHENVKSVLGDIMQNARQVIGAERASLFILDEVLGALSSYLVDGGQMPRTIPLSNGIAATTAKTKQSLIVNDCYHDPRFNKMIDYNTGFRTRSVLSAAVVSSEGVVLGVTEMVNKIDGGFTQEDQNLLESFATFAAVSLETRRLKDITERGSAQIEMCKWIAENERQGYSTPVKLTLTDEQKPQLFNRNFFAIEWNGIGLFKIAFGIFHEFGLMETFHITNELFFTFLYRLREAYNEPPYHNWIHAIDVLQYFCYQLKLAKLDHFLMPIELLAICVAAMCHDAGHQGFNNVYNVNAETPLGILFKDQSVMETHHCTIAIRIISSPECNIFHALPPADVKKIWQWVIKMILATDMAHHFKLLKNANDIMDQGPINLSNDSHRMMSMTMLMKVSDISNVSRPFEIADEWCDVLSEEFWRQGDMEKAQGLELSSPLNDRDAPNSKPKGQIGFYNFICIPLYQAIARIFPELEVNVEAVKSNLERWKQIQADLEAKQAALLNPDGVGLDEPATEAKDEKKKEANEEEEEEEKEKEEKKEGAD